MDLIVVMFVVFRDDKAIKRRFRIATDQKSADKLWPLMQQEAQIHIKTEKHTAKLIMHRPEIHVDGELLYDAVKRPIKDTTLRHWTVEILK